MNRQLIQLTVTIITTGDGSSTTTPKIKTKHWAQVSILLTEKITIETKHTTWYHDTHRVA